MSILRRTFCFSLIAVLFFLTAHRLPAPIQEESPTPAPTEQATAKPKPKRTTKPKPKAEASESATNPVKVQPSLKQSRFAGTWVGTIPAFPTGPQATVLTVDPRETTMQHTWTDHPPSRVSTAEINGQTIQATFPNGVATYTFSLTPESDGTTARARLQAFMNDNTAVFRRVSESSPGTATKVSTTQSSQVSQPTAATSPMSAPVMSSSDLPVAKPVPNKPGFVYNPFDSNTKVLLDVRGKASGTKVKDPSGRLFIVP